MAGLPGRCFAATAAPIAEGGALLVLHDVTEIERVDRTRRDFIANVSHELKTPLTVISGFIETLQDLDVDERQHARFLQLMQEQAKNMQRLVADLLTLSSLEGDQNPLHQERVAVVPRLLKLSRAAAARAQGTRVGSRANSRAWARAAGPIRCRQWWSRPGPRRG